MLVGGRVRFIVDVKSLMCAFVFVHMFVYMTQYRCMHTEEPIAYYVVSGTIENLLSIAGTILAQAVQLVFLGSCLSREWVEGNYPGKACGRGFKVKNASKGFVKRLMNPDLSKVLN